MDEPKLPEPSGAPDPGIALLVGLAVGYGYYWFASSNAAPEGDEDGEDLDDDEIERPERIGRLDDAVTDSIIERPARFAKSGRDGDCYKAVKLLPASRALANNEHERRIFKRVLKAVADDCRGAEDAVDRAMDDIERTRDEIEEMLDVDTSEVDSDPDRIIAARRQAQAAMRRGDLTRTRRKKVPRDPVVDILDKVASTRGATKKGGRPSSGASHRFKKPGGPWVRMKAEKAKTKRGFKWRKEEID